MAADGLSSLPCPSSLLSLSLDAARALTHPHKGWMTTLNTRTCLETSHIP